MSLKVFSQFNSQISYWGCWCFFTPKKSPCVFFPLQLDIRYIEEPHSCQERAFRSQCSASLPNPAATHFPPGLWVCCLSLFHAQKKWLLLVEISTTCMSQFSSVTQLCPTLCNPMDCSTPGLHVHHQLPELAQTHINQVGDAIQPSHPLSCPSLPTFNLAQHQCLFKWVSSSHQVAKVLEFQLQCQSFQWIFRTDFL